MYHRIYYNYTSMRAYILISCKKEQCDDATAVVNDKVGSLNIGSRDIGSDNVNNTVDTRKMISRVKPDLLS